MDEDTLIIPAAWRRRLHPRRGGTAGTRITLDPAAATALAARTQARAAKIGELLDHPRTAPEAAAAARRHLSGLDDPFGASIVGQIVDDPGDDPRAAPFQGLVDAWCAEHGAALAAAAVAGLCRAEPTWRWIERGKVSEAWVQLREPERPSFQWWQIQKVLRRMRAVLAAADDTEYERAVARLAEGRDDFVMRLATAYMVPTRQDWVDELLAELPGVVQRNPDLHYTWTGLLWCSIGSAEQLRHLRPLPWNILARADVLTTAVDAVGVAMGPLLAEGYDVARHTSSRKALTELLAILPSDQAMLALLDRADQDPVRPALRAAMKRFPLRAARLLASATSESGKASTIASALLHEHVVANPELPSDLTGVSAAPETTVARVPEATATGVLPASLVKPPWTREPATRKPVVIDGLVPPSYTAVTWKPGERESWSRHDQPAGQEYWSWRLGEYQAGRLPDWEAAHLFTSAPEEWVRPLFPDWSPHGLFTVERVAKQLAARYELDTVPLLIRVAVRNPASNGEALLPFLTAEIAELMADWAFRLKSARPIAFEWLDRHRIAAALPLTPVALGPVNGRRRAAEHALHRIARSEGTEPVVEAAGRVYGDAAADAVVGLLADGPSGLLPIRVPKIGDWADPVLLPQVLLKGRDRALPAPATRHLLTMLALAPTGMFDEQIDEVRQACDAPSLAEFSRAVFDRWQAAGSPSKDDWALTQLGAFGDDEAARRLAPLIRTWPGKSRHRNAAAGLEVLARIGTDLAHALTRHRPEIEVQAPAGTGPPEDGADRGRPRALPGRTGRPARPGPRPGPGRRPRPGLRPAPLHHGLRRTAQTVRARPERPVA